MASDCFKTAMATSCQPCGYQPVFPDPPPFNPCPPDPPAQGCSAVWGEIVGDPGNQTDLPPYLDTLYARPGVDNDFQVDQTIHGAVIGTGKHADNEYNLTFGVDAGQELLPFSDYNLAIGKNALKGATSSSLNIAIGHEAMAAGPSTGSFGRNIAVGNYTYTDGLGSLNVLIGNDVMRQSVGTAFNDNVVIGDFAAYGASVKANRNVFVGGASSASVADVEDSVAVGYGTSTPYYNSIAIGANATTGKTNQAVIGGPLINETVLRGNLVASSKTITAIGTTGNQTINKTAGSVVFAAGSTNLTVTNSFAIAPTSGAVGSIILVSLRTADSTAVLGPVLCSVDGSFVITMKTAPTAATRVDFLLIN